MALVAAHQPLITQWAAATIDGFNKRHKRLVIRPREHDFPSHRHPKRRREEKGAATRAVVVEEAAVEVEITIVDEEDVVGEQAFNMHPSLRKFPSEFKTRIKQGLALVDKVVLLVH